MHNQFILDSYASTCLKNIESYEIDTSGIIRASNFVMSDSEIGVPSKGSVVGEGVLSFTGSLNAQNRADAQNAYLFATLVANKKFPNQHEGKDNYELFRKVMIDCGWSPISTYFSDLQVTGTSVRMDKLVLEILAAVVAGVALPGSTSALLLKVAGDAIAALKQRDTALTVYERNLLQHGVGGLAVGACTEMNGEAIMAVGAVRFLRKNTSTKVMFVDVDVRDVQLYCGQTMFAKNEFVADRVREGIKDKLGDNLEKKVEDYEI